MTWLRALRLVCLAMLVGCVVLLLARWDDPVGSGPVWLPLIVSVLVLVWAGLEPPRKMHR